jgi:hypothetical protein
MERRRVQRVPFDYAEAYFSTPETHRRQRRLPEKARIPNVGLVQKSRLAIRMWHHCAVLGEQHRNARLGLNYTLLFDSRDGRC